MSSKLGLLDLLLLFIGLTALPILGVSDIMTGLIGGSLIFLERLVLGGIMLLLLLVAISLIQDNKRLTGIGLSAVCNAYLVRQAIVAVWSGKAIIISLVIMITVSYLIIEFVGLVFLMVGWRHGEHRPGREDRLQPIPLWLQPISSGANLSTKSSSLIVALMASGVLIAYLMGSVIWPNSSWLPIIVAMLLMILGIAGLVTLGAAIRRKS